ncbi:MAG TPA: group II intron reverse transcriptase/maturase [Actinocrinis sp.]|uniref:group II intron reverse transcriptase/maturase n=1 Tax=Actinocrinis sp. TaxID=1920516 RepID=UPI002DDD3EA3|nr:group II intron reverse transcriptase/maturase [Actinocrinis sp.]HEV2345637.1 group II intron reverse transcriptase/maturase [Actinocrinis sp.]
MAAPGAVNGAVNGPEDDAPDWDQIDWRRIEDDVRRLRQRIFAASQAGDLKTVRNLQKLMLRSRSNALLSVRRVAQDNAGRKTPGIDGRTALLPTLRAQLADRVQRQRTTWRPRAVRRVFIPKANGKKRGLGIPVLMDRALQAMTVNALEPEWEVRFEARTYGFRPGRSCQDAIASIFWTMANPRTKRRWVLDADLTAAFDRADHAHILDQLGAFPARGMVAAWLKAGVVDQGQFTPTEEGTPQGGVISPLIFNIALHGMAAAAGTRWHWDRKNSRMAAVPGTPVTVVYADDLVALCDSREQALAVKTRLTPWLAARGLAFNEDKTRVVDLGEGFTFLGFNVRRYGEKLLIKPSKDAVKRIKLRLATQMRALRGANAAAVLHTINPIVRGWAAYYRGVVSKATFSALDSYLWQLLYKWACFRHPGKPKRWISQRYFGQFHPARQDKWVFGDRETGAYLYKFAWTKIVRHTLVKGTSSPDDPALTEYWAKRRRKTEHESTTDRLRRRLLREQHGHCAACGGLLLPDDRQPQSPQDWERWFAAMRRRIVQTIPLAAHGPPHARELRLVHDTCRKSTTGQQP